MNTNLIPAQHYYVFIANKLTNQTPLSKAKPSNDNGCELFGYKYLIRPIDLYLAVTILVMFPVSTVTDANIHCANMAPDYYFVQPQFGYNKLEWSKIKMNTP